MSSHETYFTTGDLERRNDSISLLEVVDAGTHGLYYSAELMTQNVPFFHLDDYSMEKMEVTPTYCAARHLQDNISGLDHSWLWHLLCIEYLANTAKYAM